MLREILTAVVITTGVLAPVAASSKVITCELNNHGLTGFFVGGGDTEALVVGILGTGFQVDTTKQNILLIGHGHNDATASHTKHDNVKVSRNTKFTLYKFNHSGRYSDTNQKFSQNYTYKIYKDGSAKAGMQQLPSSKYVFMEAKGRCDNT